MTENMDNLSHQDLGSRWLKDRGFKGNGKLEKYNNEQGPIFSSVNNSIHNQF